MLGKLIKYELKASGRLFFLLYAALILVSAINMGMEPLKHMANESQMASTVISGISGFFIFGYVVLIIAVAVVTVVVIIMRFYKNLLGDEGYLMFTLPVGTDAQILGKLIPAVLWSILSFALIAGSILIVSVRGDFFHSIGTFITALEESGINVTAWITGGIFTLLLSTICGVLMCYAAMAMGANLTKNRLLGSFLGYIILYAANQVVSLISVAVLYATGFFEMLNSSHSVSVEITERSVFINGIGIYMFIYVTALNLLFAVVYYVLARYFIKNKLNLS